MVKKRIRLIVLLTAAAVGLVAVPASAQALLGDNSESPLPALGKVTDSKLPKGLNLEEITRGDQLTRDHWTPKTMAAASPMALPKLHTATGGADPNRMLPGQSKPGQGMPSTSDLPDLSGLPNPALHDGVLGDQTLGSRDLKGKLLAAPSGTGHSLTGAGQPTTLKAASTTSAESQQWSGSGAIAKSMGEVFFTRNGQDFTGSATVLKSSSNLKNHKDIVVTAAHNIEDQQGNRATNWMFVPGYHNGNKSLGEWTARELQMPSGWTRNHDEDSDVGFAVMSPLNGRHIADVVGGEKIGFNTSKDVSVSAFGYPGYRGESLKVCSNKVTRPNARNRQATARAIDCNMPKGASGGAWCWWKDKNHSDCTIVSVTAYSYDDEMSVIYGPPLGDEAKRTYEKAQRL